jgi:acetyl esterase/lipase
LYWITNQFTWLYYITLQSPWVDLTHGTPSILDDECVDFIPKFKGSNVTHAESQVLNEYKEKTAAFTEKIKKQNLGPKIWHDSFDRPDGVLQLYAPNECLAIPYVSPMLTESLGNLPPLLLVRKGISYWSLR